MAFNFLTRADSSDEEGGVDLSAWTAGAKRKQTPPRPSSGFQAVNQSANPPSEDLAMEIEPEVEAEPEPMFAVTAAAAAAARAPVAQMVPTGEDATMISSRGEQSDEDEDNVAAIANEVLAHVDDFEEEDTAPEPAAPAEEPEHPVVHIPADELEDENLDAIEDYTAGGDKVLFVLDEQEDEDGVMAYTVEFEDRHEEEITFDELFRFKNGRKALTNYNNQPTSEPQANPRSRRQAAGRRSSTRPRSSRKLGGMVNSFENMGVSDEDEIFEQETRKTRTRGRRQQEQTQYSEEPGSEDDDNEEGIRPRRKHQTSALARRSTRNANRPQLDDDDGDLIAGDSSEDDDDGDNFLLESDLPGMRKRTRKSRGDDNSGSGRGKRQRTATRHSTREGRHLTNMEEVGVDNIYRSASDEGARVPARPKSVAAKETFKQLPRSDEFRMRHSQQCEVCTNGSNFAPLINCQGCTLSYHKQCLGHRTNREHLVTKVDDGDFVLQCRRCVAWPKKKDPSAPDQGKCQDCLRHGAACQPFRPRKTPAQEQREREENDGENPSYEVEPERINNADNVLFRCVHCWRGFHFEHLPSRTDMMDLDTEADAEQRFREYSRDWKCKECLTMPAKVSGIVAWKPTDEDNYDDAMGFDSIAEDEKAYLIRWEGQSYFRACWMPGAWVWGVASAAMRKAFGKKDENQRPKMRTEEAIPEDFLRTDIVLDIKFTSIVDIRTEDIDKARIREVDKALIKYKGLTYEEAVWEKPPNPEDGDRWTDFVTAYNDWVLSRYVRPLRPANMKGRLEKARKQDFSNLEKQAQPEALVGGELMKYQMEGLNWLYYKWFTQKNAILADEMGLGKTIQIIGFLATLVQDWSCFPFLVIVPNSTCPNWRREIKRWSPSLRVVAYYGSKESRDLAYRYEMFPENSKDLRCHVVVTSYDAAADDSCRKFFRSVQWQGLIVDEGQRLKNEKTQLYGALGALKVPFKILLTGTPLQNNQRELFNLLQFLDDNFNAEALAEEYSELTQEKITELHNMIRPFFLRRTKAQVLTFLPSMAQIILPVSMSVLQKKVYRTILAKNPDLMRAIFSAEQNLSKNDKGSLSNILMQLRKCLCHPFVYSKGIEERQQDRAVSHRNLVDASSKLKLLELLLPKLQERGHRVLIFSQFLDMLDMVEDFLDGMEMQYQRLDGSVSSLQKQKRIDEFNEPGSSLFAFLLSTRAGGVGINLATADTVIILDPDFNPHQDIQALSRAHRIGQTKKVLCFQLVTRASAEEKIMQIGRKKLALDHVLIQEMDTDDANENDLASVLRHGASELFEDTGEHDIVYDTTNVDRLLDRSHMEDTQAGSADRSAETTFSHARVWAADSGALTDTALVESEEQAPDPGVWANILKERERLAAEEAAAKAEAFGRGRRARMNVDYAGDKAREEAEALDISPIKNQTRRKYKQNPDESDTDFQAEESDADSGADKGKDDDDVPRGLDPEDQAVAKGYLGTNKRHDTTVPPPFRRANVSLSHSNTGGLPTPPEATFPDDMLNCMACNTHHRVGSCPLKVAGVEHCNLCGMAHFGHSRVCPHIQSETQVRAMLNALKQSNEPEHLVREATRYLKGLKGNLVQLKKQKAAKEFAAREEAAAAAFNASMQQGGGGPAGRGMGMVGGYNWMG